MVVRIPAAALAAVAAHGAQAYPEEACGFLLGIAEEGATRVAEARPAANAAPSAREVRYLIAPREVLDADADAVARGLDLVGFYHSHTTGGASPSALDLARAWPRSVYVIVAVRAGAPSETRAWRLAPDRAAFLPEDMVQIS